MFTDLRGNSGPIRRKSLNIWGVIPLSAVDHPRSDRVLEQTKTAVNLPQARWQTVNPSMSKRIDLSDIPPVVRNVLFLCTGNICRSPAGEAVLKKLVPRDADVRVLSAGTHARDGYPAMENMVLVCKERGLDLSGHRAQRLTGEMVRQADIVLGMEHLHVEYALALELGAWRRAFNLAWFAYEDLDGDVIADPYGSSLREYRICLDAINECVTNLHRRLADRFVRVR